MSDSSSVWVDFLREIDKRARERERERWEAATEEERRTIAWEAFVNSLLNSP